MLPYVNLQTKQIAYKSKKKKNKIKIRDLPNFIRIFVSVL